MDIVLLLHSLVRYVLLLLALVGIIKTLINIAQRARMGPIDQMLASTFLILYDLQVLLGLLIILLGGLTQAVHPVVMFLGVIIAHALQAVTRRTEGVQANWRRLAFYVIPLLIILMGLAVISQFPF